MKITKSPKRFASGQAKFQMSDKIKNLKVKIIWAFAYAWSIRREFSKYFIVGVSGVAIDIGTLVLLKEKFSFIPVIAVMLNQLLVMTYNFSLNKYWSFRNQELPHKQLARYLFVSAMNYGVGVTVMYIFNHYLGFDYKLVRIATIAVMVPANFLLYKYWVYRCV